MFQDAPPSDRFTAFTDGCGGRLLFHAHTLDVEVSQRWPTHLSYLERWWTCFVRPSPAMEAASPSPSSALSFWTIRHIPSLHDPPLQEEDGKQPCKTRSHLRCVPSPGQDQNVLLILGGPQQYIELSLMGGCCLLLLYGLDTLLENCLTGGSMLCFDDGEVAGREVTFSVPSNARSNVLTVTDINHDDMYETRMEHSRNRKYIIELRFQLPQGAPR